MTDTDQLPPLPPLPPLQPGDSHMESLIEAAIQGHADTRDAMRWLVRQLVPATQPAEVTDEQIIDIGNEWSKENGWMDFEERDFVSCVRAILALRPVQVPMTDEHLSVLKEMADRCPELNLSNYDSDDVDELNSWAVEIAVYIDGITAQAKKEDGK